MSRGNDGSKRRRRNAGFSNRLPTPLLLVLGGLLLVVGALFILRISSRPASVKTPVEVSGSPSLKIDREKVDLGDVPLNKTVTVSFLLANAGDQTLRFTDTPFVEVLEGC